MQYTKEEFKKIVDKFNAEKFKWIDLLNINVTNWERTKAKIKDYPSYYNFVSAREFRYWLKHSEEDDFIQQRFCPICGKFIEVQKCGFQGKYKVGCEEHVEQIRMKNVQSGMMKKYGFITPGRSKEVWEKIRQTNLERYGVEFPLQNEKIHAKTIETGNLNGSYTIGFKKGKETKKELYGDENYNNSKQISKTKLNASEETKKAIRQKVKKTLKERYNDENYNNINQIKKTCLERYGSDNAFSVEQFKKKIVENNKKSKIKNHTTQKELFESKEKRFPNNMSYKENHVYQINKTKQKNHTTQKELMNSVKILYPNGMTYKENYIYQTNKTKQKNHTTPKELFDSNEIYANGLTYKEHFNKKCYETRKRNNSFNKSKAEEDLYDKLLEYFVDVKRQYRSIVYPFACDYYLPEYDLYIELQGYPSHGGHPFNPDNLKDIAKLERWKIKAQELNFKGEKKNQYANFIQVWTVDDPLKRKTAKENNLNFLEIFPQDFDNDYDAILEHIEKLTLQISQNHANCKTELTKDEIMKNIELEAWRNEEIFGITKGHCLDLCMSTPFPGTAKWSADNPIWDCNVAGNISPKEGYSKPEYLMKAIDNLYWILHKSIDENKYEDFVRHQKERMNRNDIELIRVIINRFTIAKICPKVTALMPSKFLEIINKSGVDISCGVCCPMAGFGGIVEGAKRWFTQKGLDYTNKIEAYDINPRFCEYYGWVQRDVLAQKVKTDKVVFVCPPFGLKTERWPDTPLERDDEFKTNYLDFHDWCKLIREYIDAPNYIFVGPEESGIRKNKNIDSGLFTKQFGIRWYPEYSNL